MLRTPRTPADRPSSHPRTVLGCVAAAALALAFAGATGDGDGDRNEAQAAAAPAADVRTPDALLKWMAAHPENAGLAVLPENGARSLRFQAGRRAPLASVRKVLVAGALTESAADLSTRIPRSAVERFYVPGSDGGAHQEADLDEPLTLQKVARAALEFSDNAAADALLHRLGTDAVDAYAKRAGMRAQDPIYSGFGELAAWTREPRWTELSPAQRARRAGELAGSVSAEQVTMPAIADQRRLAGASVAGTPQEWATLMGSIGRAGDRRLVELLDWPRRQDAGLRKRYARVLLKGGSLPGVATEAAYVKPRGRPGVAVALFLRDLPPDVEASLRKTFVQQPLLLRLASDERYRARAARVLARR